MRLEADDPSSVTIESALDRVERRTLSRRDLLKRGGVLGAGLGLAGVTGAAASAVAAPAEHPGRRSSRWSEHDPRVVVVGAGLAGVTAAYQLAKQGIRVELFESRDRIGGRCWTSRDWADGQTAEHGGEFIDTRHVHLLQLVKELHLDVDDLWKGWVGGSVWLNHVDGKALAHSEIKSKLDPLVSRITDEAKRIGVYRSGKPSDAAYSHGTATPAAVRLDRLTMLEWLDKEFPGLAGEPLGHYLNEIMSGWYGLDLDGLSACTWIDYFLIPYPGGDERWHVRGGNDLVPRRAAARLPKGVLHLERPLRAVRHLADGGYELRFGGRSWPVRADFVILALPFTTLRSIDLSRADFGPHTMASIEQLAMGHDGKVLLQYDQRFNHFDTPFGVWSGGMEHTPPSFETWESSTDEPGKSGLLTVYPGGRSGAKTFAAPKVVHGVCPEPLRSKTVGWIDDAVPGTAAHFNGRSWVDWWTGDPWTLGSYAAFGPRQMTRFWHGVGMHDGRVHFAGEHTSTYSQGFLNGGVESGDRAAIEVMRAIGVRVPQRLSSLPYSTFT
ncbi:MAG: FAD-dependent oxidoreductase [Actinomycetota bacterium]|nr:FAD-dependent oxidoreductase [Actinomycetota bacterium]